MGSIICLLVNHRYSPIPVTATEEATHWVCVRCGHKRYKPPRDFLDGAHRLDGIGGGS